MYIVGKGKWYLSFRMNEMLYEWVVVIPEGAKVLSLHVWWSLLDLRFYRKFLENTKEIYNFNDKFDREENIGFFVFSFSIVLDI